VSTPLLEVDALSVDYRRFGLGAGRGSASFRALDAVSFALAEGSALSVVGASGSGKSTLARAVLRLVKPAAGRILWRGRRYDDAPRSHLAPVRRELQVVFQDPFGSLDPRMTAAQSVAEALEALAGVRAGAVRRRRVDAALEAVGLDPSLGARYPHELSGGQCQRVAIARATIVQPALLLCDEATSALDVSVQAQIINLLLELRARSGMALVFISHNLAVVRILCEQVLELADGRLVRRETNA
jgi:ABC-type microcin C transport system duplicated ATPase subunit YejF